MGALTKEEIQKIMMNPNSPESKVYIEDKGREAYDKMVKKGLAAEKKYNAKEEKDLDNKVKITHLYRELDGTFIFELNVGIKDCN